MRSRSCLFAAAVLLLLPAQLLAGGPPWLCVPVEGVTVANSQACADLVSAALKDKLSTHIRPATGVRMLEDGNQWYLTMYFERDVALRDFDAALQGSPFSVPRAKLRPFGHVVLEIDAPAKPAKKLLADLKQIEHVLVANSESKDGLLVVTVDMPYPVEDGARGKTVAWATFQRNDLSSDPATKSESPITRRALPSYDAFAQVVAKHGAALKDIHWSTKYACRTVGCVAASEADAKVSAN